MATTRRASSKWETLTKCQDRHDALILLLNCRLTNIVLTLVLRDSKVIDDHSSQSRPFRSIVLIF